MQYTTPYRKYTTCSTLFYQDFKDTFVCNTQLICIYQNKCVVVLSGFQRYFCMQYTTPSCRISVWRMLFYQDFKDTFVCNTQHKFWKWQIVVCCFIRISKILLYAIHNFINEANYFSKVVLSGFQRYFCMQYTTSLTRTRCIRCCFIRISKILLYAIHNFGNERS